MIYVCIPSYNEGPTVGLVLWKIRRVFAEFPREYALLVVDDGSTDRTAEVLEHYAKVLPLTVIRHHARRGYGPSVEILLREAVDRTDRPKRDCAVLMHADFTHGPEYLPELIRKIESGADLVVAQARLPAALPRTWRWLRRLAPHLVPGVRVAGVKDLASGFAAMRLISLRNALRVRGDSLITADGWAANAELYGRIASSARRIETIEFTECHDLRARPARGTPWQTAKRLWKAGRQLRIEPARHRPERHDREPEPAEASG